MKYIRGVWEDKPERELKWTTLCGSWILAMNCTHTDITDRDKIQFWKRFCSPSAQATWVADCYQLVREAAGQMTVNAKTWLLEEFGEVVEKNLSVRPNNVLVNYFMTQKGEAGLGPGCLTGEHCGYRWMVEGTPEKYQHVLLWEMWRPVRRLNCVSQQKKGTLSLDSGGSHI